MIPVAEHPQLMQTHGSATMAIYHASGATHVDGPEVGLCRLCGADDRGQAWGAWVKDTFNDLDLTVPGTIVCRGCLLLTENFSTWYQKLLGRDKPQKPWTWSHFVLRGEYVVLSKADKSRMVEILLQDPEFAVIAVSGQKHLAFRARPHVWQYETVQVPADPGRLEEALAATTPLYEAGATKAEILSGQYAARSIQRIGLREWRRMEDRMRQFRGSAMTELAVFLTTKQEAAGDDGAAVPTTDGAGQFLLL